MTKKHYIYAANKIVAYCKEAQIISTFNQLDIYKAYIDLFREFGQTFSVSTFDGYIFSKLNK